MTDPGDEKLSRRYRELAREEPPAHADAAILAAARGLTPVSREASRAGSGVRPRFSTWMGPISIAAVLVLGIGVSLRMQMEQPGVETSAPPSVSEYSMPAEPAPVEEPSKAKDQAGARQDAAPPPRPKLAAPAAKPEPQAAATPELSGAVKELAKRSEAPATTIATPAQAPAPEAAPPPPVGASGGRAAAQSAPLRAKREGFAADSAATESRRIATVADPDPNRELERIALLREAGRHAEADGALEELRRRHPEFRIPDAVWERVKPR